MAVLEFLDVEPEQCAVIEDAYAGIDAACAKHFPGDGVDYRDQHFHPTVNSLSAADWYSSYGKVYKNLIGHGLLSVMAGLIAQPDVARDANPALTVMERYPDIRLITLAGMTFWTALSGLWPQAHLEKQGFQVEVYDPMADDLHGTSSLPRNRLPVLCQLEQASNQTVVRVNWCPKHALDMPRFMMEEPCVFVSLANLYHLQDVPRIKTYINAYTAMKDTVKPAIDKLMGRYVGTGGPSSAPPPWTAPQWCSTM